MPPKAQITKEMIISAGLDIVRMQGADALNVRKVAAKLNCSTQPVMYHFATVDELKGAIYSAADVYHSGYLMSAASCDEDPMLSIGLRYIKFAAEERNLFRFLFQSDKFASGSFSELFGSEELSPIFEVLQQQAEITAEQSHEAFSSLFIAVHGIASLLANNSMQYDEGYFEKVLTNIFFGVIGIMKGGTI